MARVGSAKDARRGAGYWQRAQPVREGGRPALCPRPIVSPDPVVVARGLTKRYRDVLAVEGLDLDIRRGEVYALLGRNGAGKTTAIRMLLGLIRPTRGRVEVLGRAIVPGETAVFARVGYLVEAASAYPNLTVAENLQIQRRLTGVPRSSVGEAIDLLGLGGSADRRAGQLSLGNKQRLSLARALLHRPDLLVLDEPANALDPAGIVEVRELLRSLAAQHGVTVLLSSHILSEVAHLADRIGILHSGRLIQELDRAALHDQAHGYLHVVVSDPDRASRILRASGFARIEREEAPERGLRVLDAAGRAAEVAALVVDSGLGLEALTPVPEDLESYFLRLTGGAP